MVQAFEAVATRVGGHLSMYDAVQLRRGLQTVLRHSQSLCEVRCSLFVGVTGLSWTTFCARVVSDNHLRRSLNLTLCAGQQIMPV